MVLTIGGAYAYSNGLTLQGKFPKPLIPDLTVTSITADAGNLAVVVKNTGTGKVTAGTPGFTYVYIDDLSTPRWTYSWTTLSDTHFFNAAQSSTLSPDVLTDGTYNIMACVDATFIVTERSETNNCLTTTVTVAPTLPDLVPDLSSSTFSINGEVGVDSTGTVSDFEIADSFITTDFQCGIKNIGLAAASGDNEDWCTFYFSSEELGHAEYVGTLSLPVNDVFTFSSHNSPYSTDGIRNLLQELHDSGTATVSIEHQADFHSTWQIDESDETNNNETQSITVDDSGISWVVR